MRFTKPHTTHLALFLAICRAAQVSASPIAPKDGQAEDVPTPAVSPRTMPSTASIAAMPTSSNATPAPASSTSPSPSPASVAASTEGNGGAAKDVPPRSNLKPDKLPIIPEPTDYTLGNTPICLSPEFAITFEGKLDDSSDLAAACERTRGNVLKETHRYLSIERGLEFWTESATNKDTTPGPDDKSISESADKASKIKPYTDEQRQSIMGGATVPAKSRPALERYELEIPLDGEATLKGVSALGLFRGLATFEQLFYRLEEGDVLATGAGANGAAKPKGDEVKPQASPLPMPAPTSQAKPENSGGGAASTETKDTQTATSMTPPADNTPAASGQPAGADDADKPKESGTNSNSGKNSGPGEVNAHEGHDRNGSSSVSGGSATGDGNADDCDEGGASKDDFKIEPMPSTKQDDKAKNAQGGAIGGDDEDCEDEDAGTKSPYVKKPLPPKGQSGTEDENCEDDAGPTVAGAASGHSAGQRGDAKSKANGGPLAECDATGGKDDDCEEEEQAEGSNANEHHGQPHSPAGADHSASASASTSTPAPQISGTADNSNGKGDDCEDEHKRGLHWSTKRAEKGGGDGKKGEGKGGRIYAPFGPYKITDQPAFGWRGLMLDTSRNYFSPVVMKKLFDTMALVKMNQFHWHITDSNSWPLDLSAFPELAAAAAYSQTERFDEKTVQDLIKYAGERGIDVMIEVDMPGHTASLARSHPEHIACFGKAWDTYALQPPAGQLRYANEETTAWASKLIGELVKSVKGPYMGTGGDELNKKCMEEDAETQETLKKRGMTLDAALNDFVGKVQEPIWKAKKTPVVWQEMALDHGAIESMSKVKEGAEMPIVQVCKTSADTRAVLDKGYNLVHSPSDYFYLDCGHGGWVASKNGTNSWCDPFKTWHKILSFDPFANLTSEQVSSGRVYGGQVALWAEQTDEQTLDGMLWPRAAALAELFWGGDRGGKEACPRDARKWMASIHDVRNRMVERGVRANILQPHWCALRPGMCEV